MKKAFLLIVSLFFFQFIFSQAYQFQKVIDIQATPVISQDVTGTCWSFATSSFLESEIYRKTGKQIDLSEMYQVRNTYMEKAQTYIMRQGKIQFSQGGLAHDVINSMAKYGLMPAEAFTGLAEDEERHNHIELEAALLGMVEAYSKTKKLSPKWRASISAVLDVYLGKPLEDFSYQGKNYTPKTFLEYTGLQAKDYVSLTSFTHVPYNEKFVLDIPDNFSNGSFYNLRLDEFIANINHALEKGYTISLDCDVSEPGFSAKDGVAVIPVTEDKEKTYLKEIKPERQIDATYRQQEFENYTTTDDHLMHITGMAKDQNGTIYYIVKNSWGSDPERVGRGGYIYMSASYLRLKTISVLLHKDALLPMTAEKIL